MDTKVIESAGVIIGAIIATAVPPLASWVSKKLTREREGIFFIKNTRYRAQINEVLVEIRAMAGANRVSIVEYHNGNNTINGLPFNYASMTYEKTDQTTREMMLNFQKVPISSVSELLLNLQDTDNHYIRIGKGYEDESTVEFIRYYGIQTSYVFNIGDHVKYGTIHVSWLNEDAELTDEQLQAIHYKTLYINELMRKMKKH